MCLLQPEVPKLLSSLPPIGGQRSWDISSSLGCLLLKLERLRSEDTLPPSTPPPPPPTPPTTPHPPPPPPPPTTPQPPTHPPPTPPPPLPHVYPYHWVIMDPKSNEDKVKVTNLKSSPKFQIFEFWNGHYTRHTLWSCLIRCANMKWIRWVLLKIQSGHDSVHRRTDGQTDKVIPVYPPFNFV